MALPCRIVSDVVWWKCSFLTAALAARCGLERVGISAWPKKSEVLLAVSTSSCPSPSLATLLAHRSSLLAPPARSMYVRLAAAAPPGPLCPRPQ
jgi:hypothetical protein